MKPVLSSVLVIGLVSSAQVSATTLAEAERAIRPSERTLALVLAMNQLQTQSTEGVPTLTQSIFGFEEEIQSDDPQVRAGIDEALRESGIDPSTVPSEKRSSDNSSTEAL
jgi:hypothetical protein